MLPYLQSKGYRILRWAEWCEDHMEYTVVAPDGSILTAEAEWLLVQECVPVGPRGGQPVWWLAAAA